MYHLYALIDPLGAVNSVGYAHTSTPIPSDSGSVYVLYSGSKESVQCRYAQLLKCESLAVCESRLAAINAGIWGTFSPGDCVKIAPVSSVPNHWHGRRGIITHELAYGKMLSVRFLDNQTELFFRSELQAV